MNSSPTLRESFQIQLRVLHALLMREVITRFGRENLGVLWLVVEPMLFTVGVTALWTAAGFHKNSPLPIVAFAVTGYSSVLLWRNAATRCSNAIQNNKALLYHHRVRVLDTLVTRIVLELAGATCSFVVLGSLFVSIGWMPPPADMSQVLKGWILLAWFGGSLALVIGAGTAFSETVERLWHPAAYLLFPISGAAYMVDWLPHKFQSVVLWLPMVHGVEILRRGWFGELVRPHYDTGYLLTACLLFTLCGLYLVRQAGGKIEF